MMVHNMKFYHIITILLCLMLLAQPLYARRKSTQRQLEQSVKEGKELYDEMYYMGAIEKWTEVLKVDPWNEEVKILIEKALKRYEDLNSRLEKGFTLLDEGSLEEAEGEFNFILENSSARNRDLRALVEKGLKATELARRDLELRGTGHLLGVRQAGMAGLRVADPVRDEELLILARDEVWSVEGSGGTEEPAP